MQWQAFNTCTATIQLAPAAAAAVNASFLLVNPGRYGFYRTNYSAAMWARLAAAAANPRVIPPTDLAGEDGPRAHGRGGRGGRRVGGGCRGGGANVGLRARGGVRGYWAYGQLWGRRRCSCSCSSHPASKDPLLRTPLLLPSVWWFP